MGKAPQTNSRQLKRKRQELEREEKQQEEQLLEGLEIIRYWKQQKESKGLELTQEEQETLDYYNWAVLGE